MAALKQKETVESEIKEPAVEEPKKEVLVEDKPSKVALEEDPLELEKLDFNGPDSDEDTDIRASTFVAAQSPLSSMEKKEPSILMGLGSNSLSKLGKDERSPLL